MTRPSNSKTSTSSRKATSESEKATSDEATRSDRQSRAQPGKQQNKNSDKASAAEAAERPGRNTPSDDRDLVLSHDEAEAGSPPDGAACGEEDPGSGLEFLVTRRRDR